MENKFLLHISQNRYITCFPHHLHLSHKSFVWWSSVCLVASEKDLRAGQHCFFFFAPLFVFDFTDAKLYPFRWESNTPNTQVCNSLLAYSKNAYLGANGLQQLGKEGVCCFFFSALSRKNRTRKLRKNENTLLNFALLPLSSPSSRHDPLTCSFSCSAPRRVASVALYARR